MRVKRLKLAIITAVWKRPEVFKMFAQGIHALAPTFERLNVDCQVMIAGSEGSLSKNMVLEQGPPFNTYSETENQPLAQKVNLPLRAARTWGADYVLCVGSDDIISPELMELYIGAMRKNADFIGVTDFYFYDTLTKTAAYWGGYREPFRKGVTCGAGRVISKRLLDLWQWKIWETKHNSVLDTSIDEKLKAVEHKQCIFAMKDYGVMAVDIKSSTNMTPFKMWDNTKKIDAKILTQKFKMLCAE